MKGKKLTNEQFSDTQQQANGIDGYYIVEIFGHQKYAGYCTTQSIGISAMLRVDVPPLEERERITKRGGYNDGAYVPAGATVKEGAVQGYTKLFGVGAIYAMTPCTKETCLKAVEELQPRPMMVISVPQEQLAIAAGVSQEQDPDDEDDTDDEHPF